MSAQLVPASAGFAPTNAGAESASDALSTGSDHAGRRFPIPASPAQLRELGADELPLLADEIRRRLVEITAVTGGHLGPNLGVVELTIALHRRFDSPREAIVFDTGHQAYVHKMLTGRADLPGLRTRGGTSGYPDRGESPHDVVENSHASGSIAWAHGIDRAQRLLADREQAGPGPCTVAVIGDGALTGGVALEALNDLAADRASRTVVVLNDNTRSYAPTMGGLAAHLAQLSEGTPQGADVFTALGLTYLGPIDGHDLEALDAALDEARTVAEDPQRGAPVVHVLTRKGMGFARAEQDLVDHWHATGPFEVQEAPELPSEAEATAETLPAPDAPAPPATWTARAGKALLEAARADARVLAVSAAMIDPVGLTPMQTAMPERVLDVGIAEQLALDTAAGLSRGGARPVVCLYATFLNRALDQLLLDVALHGENVTITLDRAGVTGDDGPSHHGIWDLALAAQIPGLALFAPRDGTRLEEAIPTALAIDGPAVMRYPKGRCGEDIPALATAAGSEVLCAAGPLPEALEHPEVLIVSIGALAGAALDAAETLIAEGCEVLVIDPVQALPVDSELVDLAMRARCVVTVEDGVADRGVGAAIAGQMGLRATVSQPAPPMRTLGVAQRFHPHASRAQILAEQGLDGPGIAASIRELLG